MAHLLQDLESDEFTGSVAGYFHILLPGTTVINADSVATLGWTIGSDWIPRFRVPAAVRSRP
jgi:hypothetical protein